MSLHPSLRLTLNSLAHPFNRRAREEGALAILHDAYFRGDGDPASELAGLKQLARRRWFPYEDTRIRAALYAASESESYAVRALRKTLADEPISRLVTAILRQARADNFNTIILIHKERSVPVYGRVGQEENLTEMMTIPKNLAVPLFEEFACRSLPSSEVAVWREVGLPLGQSLAISGYPIKSTVENLKFVDSIIRLSDGEPLAPVVYQGAEAPRVIVARFVEKNVGSMTDAR